MSKQRYFAYQIYNGHDSVDLAVDTDPAKLWERFANDLQLAEGGGIETIEVGQVYGSDIEDALNAVRAEEWLPGGYGTADGVGYQDDQPKEIPRATEPTDYADRAG